MMFIAYGASEITVISMTLLFPHFLCVLFIIKTVFICAPCCTVYFLSLDYGLCPTNMLIYRTGLAA